MGDDCEVQMKINGKISVDFMTFFTFNCISMRVDCESCKLSTCFFPTFDDIPTCVSVRIIFLTQFRNRHDNVADI